MLRLREKDRLALLLPSLSMTMRLLIDFGLRELPERFFIGTGRELTKKIHKESETYDQRPGLRNEC
jgi:hypothetical protein